MSVSQFEEKFLFFSECQWTGGTRAQCAISTSSYQSIKDRKMTSDQCVVFCDINCQFTECFWSVVIYVADHRVWLLAAQ